MAILPRADLHQVADSDLGTCTKVARLHIREIHDGLLPLFGERWLAQLYRGLARAPRSGVWVARDGASIAGFIAGCADLDSTYRWLLRHKGPSLVLYAAGALFKPAVLKTIPSLCLYPFRKRRSESAPDGVARAELLAMAVSSEHQGKGIGRALVNALEDALQGWNVREYSVSTNREEVQSNAFYTHAGFQPTGLMPHHALTLQRYRKKLQSAKP